MIAILIGWVGTLLYVASYLYLTFSPAFKPSRYYLGNLLAAICICVVSLALFSWQALIINLFWVVVSFAGLKDWKLGIKLPNQIVSIAIMSVIVITSVVIFSFFKSALGISMMAWSSTICYCFGYLLFTNQILEEDTYFIVNGVCSILIIPELWNDQNYPTVVLQIIWLIISITGFIRMIWQRV